MTEPRHSRYVLQGIQHDGSKIQKIYTTLEAAIAVAKECSRRTEDATEWMDWEIWGYDHDDIWCCLQHS